MASEVGQCVRRVALAAPRRTGPRQPSPPMGEQANCGDGTEAVESSPVIHYNSQTKQQNLIRREVVTVQEVEITPVPDGPVREHHGHCEQNCSRQWQKLN